MSTRKFVKIILVALTVFFVVVSSAALATAESKTVYKVDAIVLNFDVTSRGDLDVEVLDEENNILGYYADANADVRIGDVVTLTISYNGKEEEDEVIDAVCVDHLDVVGMIQWIRH